MLSLSSAIQNALFRKQVPAFEAGSTSDLALRIGLSSPLSLQSLLGALNALPSAVVVHESGPLTANYLHANAVVTLKSDGAVTFSGSLNEQGSVGDYFLLAVALPDVIDHAGKIPVIATTGNIAGRGVIGPSEKNWTHTVFIQTVTDNWLAAKTTRAIFRLAANTDPFQAFEITITGWFTGFGSKVEIIHYGN